MSSFSNPQIAAIDDALTELEPRLTEFGQSRGFALTRSHDGSFNVPRRWLHRETQGIRHEIGLIISLPMPERLERGFFPDIPCALYVAAHDRVAHMHCDARIFEALPFSSLRSSLPDFLLEAERRLETYTSDFIAKHGTREKIT